MRLVSFIRARILISLVCSLGTLLAYDALAQSTVSVTSGWAGGGEPGISIAGAHFGVSAPVIAELNGNPNDGKEIVVGSKNGVMHAFNNQGALLWETRLPNYGCGSRSDDKLYSTPAVGSLDGSGHAFVVVGYGGFNDRPCDGGVVALRGEDGSVAWTFSIKSFSRRIGTAAFLHTVYSSPALADTDGDGRLEVGFGSFDHNVYLLEHNGAVRWYYNAADTVWSSPSFADVNGDGKLEMLIGTDISANRRLRPPTRNGGYVYAFKTGRRASPRIRFRDRSAYLWQSSFDQVVFSRPIAADLLPTAGQEVVVGTGCYFPEGTNNKRGRYFRVINGVTGRTLRTLTVPVCSSSRPEIADLDGDGAPEIVLTVNGAGQFGGSGRGRLMAYSPAAPSLLWSTVPVTRRSNDSYLGYFKSPRVADLNGDGRKEVVVSNQSGVVIVDGPTGTQLSCSQKTCENDLLSTTALVRSTPAIEDLNGDGVPEIVVAAGSSLYAWRVAVR